MLVCGEISSAWRYALDMWWAWLWLSPGAYFVSDLCYCCGISDLGVFGLFFIDLFDL
jgi:hypothetical protein